MIRGTLSRRGFLVRRWQRPQFGPAYRTGLPAKCSRLTKKLSRLRGRRSGRMTARSGAIGTGGQGYLVMTELVRKRPNVRLVAVCDVDATRRKAAIAKSKLQGIERVWRLPRIARTQRHRRRYRRHARPLARPDRRRRACAGKDVYCEKPYDPHDRRGQDSHRSRQARATGSSRSAPINAPTRVSAWRASWCVTAGSAR